VSKYEPLPHFLSGKSASSLRLAFEDIEDILGFALPKSAYAHEAWWSNNETGHSHARVWMRAGWRTSEVDLASRQVTFERQTALASAPQNSGSKGDPFGCMAGTLTLMPSFDLTTPTDLWTAEAGQLLNE
jgi:hypothetical protein